jgi:hypothetical protein
MTRNTRINVLADSGKPRTATRLFWQQPYSGTISPCRCDQSYLRVFFASLVRSYYNCCIRPSERNWKTAQKFLTKSATGELYGNLTCRLSFRQHFSNLTTASYKTYHHFWADVLWHSYSAHLHILTSVKTMCGKQIDLPTFKIRVPQTEI